MARNEFLYATGTRLIPLSQDQFAIVDESDYAWLSSFRWYAAWDARMGSFYARRNTPRGSRPCVVGMHREILLRDGECVHADHISGNTLDNRRANLRRASRSENARNRKMPANNKCGFKGVCAEGDRFRAYIYIGGKQKRLGIRDTPQEAQALFQAALRERDGEFARFA